MVGPSRVARFFFPIAGASAHAVEDALLEEPVRQSSISCDGTARLQKKEKSNGDRDMSVALFIVKKRGFDLLQLG